ncbi:MAG: AAA family ATPase, partial [Clostridia bacterium]|nr:AAA family ATPase [Clostridia bacterium]
MLKQLTIKNVALISALQIEFDKNLCVLTGETGAGKSIIVDSLAFVLGSKADKTLIKSGEEKAVVEAVFEIDEQSKTYELMQELALNPEEIIVLHRTMTLQGKNECRVNGKICPLSILKTIANTLVDIFGQNEHVNFLQASTHLKIIDEFRKFPDYDKLEQVVTEYKKQQSLLEEFGGSESERERTLSLLEYEINEIEKAHLEIDEEETLTSKKDKIVNVEKIAEALKTALSHLRDSSNISTEIWMANSSLQSVSKYDEDLVGLSDRIINVKYELDDVIDTLDSKLYYCNYDPNELDAIIFRLEEIKRLKRKYGKTITDVLEFLQQSKQKYNDLIDA